MNRYLQHDLWSVVVIWGNIAGCSAAFVVTAIVAVRARRYRVGLAAVAVLAACYVIGYGALLFVDVAPADWSRVMRIFGVAAWPLVWIWPQLRLLRKTVAIDAAVTKEMRQRGGS